MRFGLLIPLLRQFKKDFLIIMGEVLIQCSGDFQHIEFIKFRQCRFVFGIFKPLDRPPVQKGDGFVG